MACPVDGRINAGCPILATSVSEATLLPSCCNLFRSVQLSKRSGRVGTSGDHYNELPRAWASRRVEHHRRSVLSRVPPFTFDNQIDFGALQRSTLLRSSLAPPLAWPGFLHPFILLPSQRPEHRTSGRPDPEKCGSGADERCQAMLQGWAAEQPPSVLGCG